MSAEKGISISITEITIPDPDTRAFPISKEISQEYTQLFRYSLAHGDRCLADEAGYDLLDIYNNNVLDAVLEISDARKALEPGFDPNSYHLGTRFVYDIAKKQHREKDLMQPEFNDFTIQQFYQEWLPQGFTKQVFDTINLNSPQWLQDPTRLSPIYLFSDMIEKKTIDRFTYLQNREPGLMASAGKVVNGILPEITRSFNEGLIDMYYMHKAYYNLKDLEFTS